MSTASDEKQTWNWHRFVESGVLLILGALLTAWVVPKINNHRIRTELRAQKRIETVQRNIEVDVRLNNVLTELESFYRDHPEKPTPDERKELARRLADIYRQFNEIGWWWPEEMFAQGRLLRLMPAEREPLARHTIEQYKANLVESTRAVDALWYTLVRSDYTPDDPQVATLVRQTRSNCERLQRARDEVALGIMRVVYGER